MTKGRYLDVSRGALTLTCVPENDLDCLASAIPSSMARKARPMYLPYSTQSLMHLPESAALHHGSRDAVVASVLLDMTWTQATETENPSYYS